jgi:hypothetical protein
MQSPSRQSWYENDFLSAHVSTDSGVVYVVRNERQLQTFEDIERAFGALNRALAGLDHEQYPFLFMDFRRAMGRNDDDFERAVERYRAETLRGFRKVAVLVRSAPGRLQAQRHARTDGVPSSAFMDEVAALEWLHA